MPNASDRAKLQKAANNVSGEGGWWKYFGEYVLVYWTTICHWLNSRISLAFT